MEDSIDLAQKENRDHSIRIQCEQKFQCFGIEFIQRTIAILYEKVFLQPILWEISNLNDSHANWIHQKWAILARSYAL